MLYLHYISSCCIPLKSKAPCGLLVMQRAALMCIPIISTETYSMRTVIPDDSYGFLCKRGDAYDMANKIKLLMSNDSIKKDITERTRKRMELFTKEAVGKQIYTAVMEIEKSN